MPKGQHLVPQLNFISLLKSHQQNSARLQLEGWRKDALCAYNPGSEQNVVCVKRAHTFPEGCIANAKPLAEEVPLEPPGFGLRPSASEMSPLCLWVSTLTLFFKWDRVQFLSFIYFTHGQVQECPSRWRCISLYAPLRLQTCQALQKKGAEKKNQMQQSTAHPWSQLFFSLQKTIFVHYVIEPPCLMTLLMHCYQVVPSVFGQMCSLACLLSINYLYLKFNGSYIYLDICT